MVCSPRLRTVAHPLTLSLSKGVSRTPAHSAAIVLPAQAGEPRPCLPGESRGVFPLSGAASRSGGCAPSYQKTSEGGWGGPTNVAMPTQVSPWPLPLPCFPLSISGHFPPRSSAPVRLAPWQIRLVPLCRLFRRPPTGPSDHRPASAWQIRLVPLCRLVRRASIPSCAGLFQAQAARKNAQHNSKQVKSPFDQGIGGGVLSSFLEERPAPCGS